MKKITLDVETFSGADLRKRGMGPYFASPDFLLLMLSWKEHGGEIQTWDLSQDDTGNLERFLSLATDSRVIISAWNAKFEWNALRAACGIEVPWSRLHCDMVAAQSLGLPASLAYCGAAININEKYLKQPDGRRLINKFCKPRRPTKHKPWARNDHETDPEDWALFVDYNRQDVRAEARIARRLSKWV